MTAFWFLRSSICTRNTRSSADSCRHISRYWLLSTEFLNIFCISTAVGHIALFCIITKVPKLPPSTLGPAGVSAPSPAQIGRHRIRQAAGNCTEWTAARSYCSYSTRNRQCPSSPLWAPCTAGLLFLASKLHSSPCRASSRNPPLLCSCMQSLAPFAGASWSGKRRWVWETRHHSMWICG